MRTLRPLVACSMTHMKAPPQIDMPLLVKFELYLRGTNIAQAPYVTHWTASCEVLAIAGDRSHRS